MLTDSEDRWVTRLAIKGFLMWHHNVNKVTKAARGCSFGKIAVKWVFPVIVINLPVNVVVVKTAFYQKNSYAWLKEWSENKSNAPSNVILYAYVICYFVLYTA